MGLMAEDSSLAIYFPLTENLRPGGPIGPFSKACASRVIPSCSSLPAALLTGLQGGLGEGRGLPGLGSTTPHARRSLMDALAPSVPSPPGGLLRGKGLQRVDSPLG